MHASSRIACLVVLLTAPGLRADELSDPLPTRAVLRLGTSRFKAYSYVAKLAFTPDGAHLFSSGVAIQKWAASNGKLLETWPIDYGEMLDLSRDGRWMLVGDSDRNVRLVDVSTGKVAWMLTKYPTALAAFAPDGKTFACSLESEKALALRDLDSGATRAVLEGAEQRLRVLAYSPDGKYLAGSEQITNLWNGTVDIVIWDTSTGKLRTRISSPHQGLTYALAFSPDNRLLIVGGQRHVRVFDVETGRSLYVLGHQTRGQTLVEPGGKWLLAGGAGVSWDLVNGCARLRLTPPHEPVGALAISRDGKTIATASSSIHRHTIDLWDAATGRRTTTHERHQAEIDEVAFLHDDRHLVTRSLSDGTIRVWDIRTGKQNRVLEWGSAPYQIAGSFGFLSRDVLLAGGRRWQLTSGQPLADIVDTLDRKERIENTSTDRRNRQSVRVSPDGRYAADLDMRRRVRVWDVGEKQVLFRIEPLPKSTNPNAPIHYAFSTDSKTLVVSHQNETATRVPGIRLYDIATGKLRTSYRTELFEVYDMQCAPDGEHLLVSAQNAVEWRKLATGDLLQRFVRDPRIEPRSGAVAVSRDSRLVALESNDAELILWETATGKQAAGWASGSGPVRALAFSSSGRQLLTGSRDSSALLWSLAPAPDSAALLKTSPDGQLWDQLADEPVKAYAAVFALAAAPERALTLLGKRLTAVPAEETQQIQKWIKDQADSSFKVREEAARQLRLRGPAVAPYIRTALKQPPALETVRRLEEILRAVEASGPSPDRLRDERSIQVLEMLDTPESRQLLETLAGGAAGSPRTTSAQIALRRLKVHSP